MSRHRAIVGIAIACVAALAVAGCKNSTQVFEDQNEGGWFAKPINMLGKPDWARPTNTGVNLGPQGPVAPEDMVSADGRCATPTAALAQAAESAPAQPPAPADRRSARSPAISLARLCRLPPTASADPGLQRLEPATSGPVVAGGIALGMTECQAVQRAGSPNNVAIGAGERGERKVVLTYLSGPWPGIYTFNDGRLKVY